MGSKGGSTIPVTDYRYSLHYGICNGELDSINRVRVADKIIWCANETGRSDISVDLPNLFGGDKKEGGVEGTMEFYPGSATQLASTELANRRGKTPTTTPGGRHIGSLFFRGNKGDGFKWSTNNPYMPKVDISVTRLPSDLTELYKTVYSPQSVEHPTPAAPLHTGVFRTINVGVPTLYGIPNMTGVRLVDDLVNNGSQETHPIQGQYVDDYIVWGAQDPGNWAYYAEGLAVAFGFGTLVRDFRLDELGITDYEMDNGVVSVEFKNFGRDLNGWAHSLRNRIYAIPADANGLPDPTGAVEIANTTNGPSDSDNSDTYWSTSATLPTGTKWVRYSQYHIPFGAGGLYWKNADVIVRWEELVHVHCPVNNEDPGAGMGTLPNANPSHMLYELLIDPMVGKGFSPSIINTQSFIDAAQTLYNEGFGLMFKWVQRGEVEKIMGEILSHIQANIYTNMRTGLIEIKLLRDDYDTGTVRTLDGSNSVVSKFHRRTITETTNEIIVKWTNPATEKKETVRDQDDANVAEQGGIVSTERDYYGVRSAQLAAQLVQRDLASMSALTASFTVHASREFWDVNPGDILLVDSEDDDVIGLVARIGKVDRGKSGELPMVFECTEDLFGLEAAQYIEQPPSAWVEQSTLPVPFVNVEIQTAPWAMMSQVGVDPDAEYPRVMAIVAGEKPSRTTVSFDLFAPTVDAGGNSSVSNRGEMLPTDYGELVDAWVREATTTLQPAFYNNFAGAEGPEQGALAIIGTGETGSEIVLFKEYLTGSGTWKVSRGMLDTVPQAWPIGTPIWFITTNFVALDQTDIAVGETVAYQLRSNSDSAEIDLYTASQEVHTFTNRPDLPFRPANVKINGVAFADIILSGVDGTITWSDRDRLTEDGVLQDWDAATVTPEVGQTTSVILYDGLGAAQLSYVGETGTSLVIPWSDLLLVGEDYLYMEVNSQREGVDSLQTYTQTVEIVALLKVAQQTEYVITGLALDAISVASFTQYVITDEP